MYQKLVDTLKMHDLVDVLQDSTHKPAELLEVHILPRYFLKLPM